MTASKRHYQPVEVLPHEPPMVLIDRITGWGDDWIETQVDRHQTRHFRNMNGVISTTVALEYLCQSAASHAGIRQLEAGKPVTIGFIVGARFLEIDSAEFFATNHYEVRVDQTFRDDEGIGVYDCRLYAAGDRTTQIARTLIKAVMPDDPFLVIEKLKYQTSQ